MSAGWWFTAGFFTCFALFVTMGTFAVRKILRSASEGQHAEVTRDEP